MLIRQVVTNLVMLSMIDTILNEHPIFSNKNIMCSVYAMKVSSSPFGLLKHQTQHFQSKSKNHNNQKVKTRLQKIEPQQQKKILELKLFD